jgi:hypothetical protein
MKRTYYKESFIALSVILFFDFLRLFHQITIGESNFFDFSWIALLIILVFFTYLSNQDKKLIHPLTLILGILPFILLMINLIQIVSTGLETDFNFYFMLFEVILITGIDIIYFIEFKKSIDKNNENSKNCE